MANEISNSDDIIDSRDVIERIKELEEERADLATALDDADKKLAETAIEDTEDHETATEAFEEAQEALEAWDDTEEGQELRALISLESEAENYADDWKCGATLIRKSYFVEYCEELVKDIGDMPHNIPDYIVIDWEATANNLKVDYTEVDFDGVTYLVR